MSSQLFFARSKISLFLLRSKISFFLLRSKKKLGRLVKITLFYYVRKKAGKTSKDNLILLREKKSWEVHVVKISLFYYVRKKTGK